MPTERNPKRQAQNSKEIPSKQGPGGKNCAKMENFNIQIFLAFEHGRL
jgi:hypothetical protein